MAKAEFSVLEGSSLIGKTIGEVEDKFKIRVDHIHNPTFSKESKLSATKDRVINERLILKVEGSWESVGQITRASVE